VWPRRSWRLLKHRRRFVQSCILTKTPPPWCFAPLTAAEPHPCKRPPSRCTERGWLPFGANPGRRPGGRSRPTLCPFRRPGGPGNQQRIRRGLPRRDGVHRHGAIDAPRDSRARRPRAVPFPIAPADSLNPVPPLLPPNPAHRRDSCVRRGGHAWATDVYCLQGGGRFRPRAMTNLRPGRPRPNRPLPRQVCVPATARASDSHACAVTTVTRPGDPAVHDRNASWGRSLPAPAFTRPL